jgi:hypothetical protein
MAGSFENRCNDFHPSCYTTTKNFSLRLNASLAKQIAGCGHDLFVDYR